ncbi:hypothetical protein NDN08_001418 [Rhodosorus marinus]|uniref:Ubiquitin carboxyl-terminal hydrolase n=1 Tax=Rhodosorus marinus TaxID=101924 RepID=A0AAV8UQY6_9RHOD|nr:hypothetical protein NDN08_001418 [Rhodosorus marinus]
MLFGSLSVEEWQQLLVEGGRGPDLSASQEEQHLPEEEKVREAVQAFGTRRSAQAYTAGNPQFGQVTSHIKANGFTGFHAQGEGINGLQLPQKFQRSAGRQSGTSAPQVPTTDGQEPKSMDVSMETSSTTMSSKRSWAVVASSGLPKVKPEDLTVVNGQEIKGRTKILASSSANYRSAKEPVKYSFSLEDHVFSLFGVQLVTTVDKRIPRGLVNGGNRCFVNVVIQSLLSCLPFRQLLVTLECVPPDEKTPLLESFVYLSAELFKDEGDFKRGLEPVRPDFFFARAPNPSQGRGSREDSFLALMTGDSQEDAQEFLVHALDQLHEETLPGSVVKSTTVDDDGGGWHEVGLRGRNVVVQRNEFVPSCISSIFGGLQRSELRRYQQKPSVTREPFMCLQLDIENSHVLRLEDALTLYFEPESLEDYTLESSKETVEAKKHYTLDRLPRVLILNLKRFSYNPEARQGTKIMKRIDYPEELDIQLSFLSSNFVAPTPEQRKYKLTSVVTHIGKDMVGGHYTCDVKIGNEQGERIAGSEWLHCDDSTISPVNRNAVFNSQAYLLFYTIAADAR